MKNISSYILGFHEIDRSKLALAGGKGANLGELCQVGGIHVPDGFCITTEAFIQAIEETPSIHKLIDKLSNLKPGDRSKVSALSADIRNAIEAIGVSGYMEAALTSLLSKIGYKDAYAVRSSATAEDLPTASFAGQQDTYLNVIGKEAILKHISKCWASLFTDRAVTYRIQNGFDHHKVHLAVVVQKMVFPQVAGILFTADPVSGNRKVLSIDASFGLGEALVSGLVNADTYKVKDSEIIDKKVSAKKLAIYALPGGGTQEQEIDAGQQNVQALTDEQVLKLEYMGRKIEEHFGAPQDIEWCLADDTFYIVQSRPITTLYPAPEVNDKENHVYLSVGHQQMMTDAMKPLGISFRQLINPFPFPTAGGRMFVDVTKMLSSVASRQNLLDMAGHLDPLTKDALMTIIERDGFINMDPDNKTERGLLKSYQGMSAAEIQAMAGDDPGIVSQLVNASGTAIAALKENIRSRSGLELLDYILEDTKQMKILIAAPQNLGVINAAVNAAGWINEKINAWLGEKNVADTLSQSLSGNVTAEMGLELLNVSDVIRPYPEVISYLQHTRDDNFLDDLPSFKGGQQVRDAIVAYLDKYGMRCAGEIDITRPRWSEKPATPIPMILSNIKNLDPGAGKQKFEQGFREAMAKKENLLEQLRQLSDGDQKAAETKQMIDLIRDLAGYREYPKYAIVTRYFIYKQALLKEAERLVQNDVINRKEDIYYLSFEELREVVRSNKVDYQLIDKRKEAFKTYEKLTPPRVLTSDGEAITGQYNNKDLPANAIPALAVSSGVIEGRARVILNIEDADIEDGDILVTRFTDPSWTPIFVSIKGLVTEVGGLMTHGAVIAREYGLPAVVGVDNATKLIKDGQRIRVNGTDGYVEIL